MRDWFRRLTLRWKLALVTGAVCAAVLLVTVVSLARVQYTLLVEAEREEVRSLATLVGRNCAAALRFNDDVFGRELLASLAEKPAVIGAVLRTPNGEVLASWWRPGAEGPLPGWATVHQHVIHGGDRVLGQIDLVVDIRSKSAAALARLTGAAVVVALAAACVGAGLIYLLERLITRPIGDLTRTARIIARRGDYSVRAPLSDGGEVGELIGTFNRMLDQIAQQDRQLQQSRADLLRKVDQLTAEVRQRVATEKALRELESERVELGRAAGKAEVAAGVLHNVGNVLNSINVSVSLLDQRIRAMSLEGLARAARLLERGIPEFAGNPARIEALRDYIAELAVQLEMDRAEWRRELETLVENVTHVREIVSRQQEHARQAGRVEVRPIAPIIENALRLVELDFRCRRVRIDRDYAPDAVAAVDQHALLQILVNLFRNAAVAVEPTPEGARRVWIRLVASGSGYAIEVEDNGVGIPPENLALIFQPGFTTTEGGHGYGLHSSSLTARSLGGRLDVESAGPGAGARFRLEIPTRDPAAASADEPDP